MLLGLSRVGSSDGKFLEVIMRIGHGGKVYLEVRDLSIYMGSFKKKQEQETVNLKGMVESNVSKGASS